MPHLIKKEKDVIRDVTNHLNQMHAHAILRQQYFGNARAILVVGVITMTITIYGLIPFDRYFLYTSYVLLWFGFFCAFSLNFYYQKRAKIYHAVADYIQRQKIIIINQNYFKNEDLFSMEELFSNMRNAGMKNFFILPYSNYSKPDLPSILLVTSFVFLNGILIAMINNYLEKASNSANLWS